MLYTPYTYLLTWTTQNKHYYGVRYSKKNKISGYDGCHPDDLFVTYFTSSKHVKEFITKFGLPDKVEIRRTFIDSKAAVEWERKVLRRLNVRDKSIWLNRSNGTGRQTPCGIKHPNYGKNTSDVTKQKISKKLLGREMPDATKQKISQSNKGKKKPPRSEQHKKLLSISNRGRTGSKNSNFGNKWNDEQRRIASKNTRELYQSGKRTPPYKPIIFRGAVYNSIQEAASANFPPEWSYNRCWYNIKKEGYTILRNPKDMTEQ